MQYDYGNENDIMINSMIPAISNEIANEGNMNELFNENCFTLVTWSGNEVKC